MLAKSPKSPPKLKQVLADSESKLQFPTLKNSNSVIIEAIGIQTVCNKCMGIEALCTLQQVCDSVLSNSLFPEAINTPNKLYASLLGHT